MSNGLCRMIPRGRKVKSTYLYLAVVLLPFLLFFYFLKSPLPNSNRNTPYHQAENIVLYQAEKNNTGLIFTGDAFSPSLAKVGCVIPQLNLDDPDIMKFYQQFPAVSCGNDFDWVKLSGGKFIITPEAKEKHGVVSCDLTPLVRNTDFKTSLGNVIPNVQDGSDITHDFYKVDCKGSDRSTYSMYHAGVHKKPEVVQRKNEARTGKNALDLDVIIIGQDSLSRMAWRRHLPLTRKYLVETLGATEMGGHTVLGDGTPATMFPLLTGKREEDLPEARRGYKGAQFVDRFPWIWKDFSKAGYVTAWQEDQPGTGTFHYRLLGFDKEPVDHFYRPFSVYTERHHKKYHDGCLGSKPQHVIQNDYMKDVLDVYKGQRKMTFTFKSQYTHSDNNYGSKLDAHMKDHIKQLNDSGHLDNALLIVMADHGARFSKVRAFAQGKLEERMPYFAMRLPPKFQAKYPNIMKNIKINSQRLTTPFDVHETLLEILDYTGSGKADIYKRGVSLFKEIPIDRDCKSADVDPHWCFCLDWTPVSKTDPLIGQIMLGVIDMLNEVTSEQRDNCALLSLKEVVSAAKYKVKDDVLKFKDTSDGGRGRFGVMNDKTKHSKLIYQISFITTPGNGAYEATVTHNLKTNKFSRSLNSVSRTNKYGKSPWCIMDRIPQLRPYCVCNAAPPTGTADDSHH